MPKLEELLDRAANGRRKVRLRSIVEIGLLGKPAREGVPGLVGLIAGEADEQVRQTIVAALGDVGGPEALAALGEAVDDESPHVRAAVAISFRKLREKERAMALFKSLATSDDPAARSAAVFHADFFFRDGEDLPDWMPE